jgi:hypothetical protein
MRKKMGYSKKGNYFTLHGQVHEGLALGKYKEQTKCRVGQYGLITCPDEPWLGCSPDGVTHCGKLVEIKCPVTRCIGKSFPILCQSPTVTNTLHSPWGGAPPLPTPAAAVHAHPGPRLGRLL